MSSEPSSSPVAFPPEITDLIVCLLDDYDPLFIGTLKSLSLVSSQLRTTAQARLFRRLVIRFDPHRLPNDLKDRHIRILRENPIASRSIEALYLLGLADDGEESDRICHLLDTLDSSRINSLHLASQQYHHPSMKIITRIPSFTLLSILHLENFDSDINISFICNLPLLKALELVNIHILYQTDSQPSLDLSPRLERLVVKNVDIYNGFQFGWRLLPILAEFYKVDLGHLEEFETNSHISSGHAIENLAAVRPTLRTFTYEFAGWLSTDDIFATQLWHTEYDERLFDPFESVDTLKLIPTSWNLDGSEKISDFFRHGDLFYPPNHVRSLYILLTWQHWYLSQKEEILNRMREIAQLLDAMLERAYAERWNSLVEICFSWLVPWDGFGVETLPLSITDADMPHMTSRGVSVFVRRNELSCSA